ncbi:hypothetical protein MYSTI_06415 [Myxococcus stipitatus DSM 14675]|uniref:Uncharacterized protein n=1 Tax=Myxococcus stipitatus (strain DSM 14675 / JCM 12634 / Mx s8) TaxID=1278073 RepID=L7UI42_MYXSD|nr:hypothetical protein [Myxococcus stipitatus]AGC47688.1 hypothetical protein MYSTI_06415 [Myxococcus stipitatus DSM 14675]
MVDFLKGAASLLAGNGSGGVGTDGAGDARGLPPLISHSIKTVEGVATGNVLLAASGAVGVADELKKNPPAKTEYSAGKVSFARQAEGYASSAAALLAAGARPLDPKMLEYEAALKVLEANFDQLDLADGKKSGSLSKEELRRVANDASLSPQLRGAARFLMENTALFERVDSSGLGSQLFSFMGALHNDDRIKLSGIRSELKRVREEFVRYGRPEAPRTPPKSEPETCPPTTGTRPPTTGGTRPPSTGGTSPGTRPPTTGGASPGTRPPTTGGQPPRPGGTEGSKLPTSKEPDFGEYLDAVKVLRDNWGTFDTAVGAKDDRVSRENLVALLENPAVSSTLKRAAQFFKDHPEYFDRLEMAAGKGSRDGVIGPGDVTAELALSGGKTPSTSTEKGSNVRALIDDPRMSIEDKVQAILGAISSETEDEILEVMGQMASAGENRAVLGTTDADKRAAAKIDGDMRALELRLQRLVEKRKSMFDLMSNMSAKFNEMAKTAISNLRNA